MFKTFDQRTEEFQRKILAEMLAQCAEAQQAFFLRLFPGKIPAGKLQTAYELCERTVLKNQRAEENREKV